MNKALSALLACVMFASMLTACVRNTSHDLILKDSGGSAGDAVKTPLTFFGFKADAMNLTAIENALQGFMKDNPDIDITYEGIKGNKYWEAFDRRDATGGLDDIFMMHHDHLVYMSQQGKLADLSGIRGLDGFTDEAKEQFFSGDGSVYFIPTQITTYNLYVNYDLLTEHGQEVPTDWGQFQEVCDYFASQGVVPIVANNRNSIPTLIQGRGLFDLYQLAESEVDLRLEEMNASPALLAEELSDGVSMVKEMLDRGWFDVAEVLATEQTSDDLELFLKGDRPFMLTGGWASGRVASKEPGFSYGVYPYPILDDGSVLLIQVDTCISVNANSPHLEEAKRFVEHLIEPDVMWEYCDSQASYSPLKSEGRLPSDEALVPSTEYLGNGRIVFRAEYRLNLPTENALAACTKVLLEGGSVSEAQAVLASELQK